MTINWCTLYIYNSIYIPTGQLYPEEVRHEYLDAEIELISNMQQWLLLLNFAHDQA